MVRGSQTERRQLLLHLLLLASTCVGSRALSVGLSAVITGLGRQPFKNNGPAKG
jgi:hypothetical protein